MRRLLVVAALLATMPACSLFRKTDKAYVADVSAERLYQVDRYRRLCQEVKGPPTCKQMQTVLNTLEDCAPEDRLETGGCKKPIGLVPLADQVRQIGAIPNQERKELNELVDQLRRLP